SPSFGTCGDTPYAIDVALFAAPGARGSLSCATGVISLVCTRTRFSSCSSVPSPISMRLPFSVDFQGPRNSPLPSSPSRRFRLAFLSLQLLPRTTPLKVRKSVVGEPSLLSVPCLRSPSSQP
ncbi:hypothetical protein AMTR_s00180p00050130, partial [Amborella trichopoda]